MQALSFFILVSASIFPALIILAFYFSRKDEELKKFLLFLGLTTVVVFVLKYLFAKARPGSALVFESTPSFPSMHSALAFGAAVFVAQVRKNWAPLAFSFAALIAYSRMFLGVHSGLDVVAGAVLGSAIAYGILKR